MWTSTVIRCAEGAVAEFPALAPGIGHSGYIVAKPKSFIASSMESPSIAEAANVSLDHDFEASPWHDHGSGGRDRNHVPLQESTGIIAELLRVP
jgi:hypothetical protein